MSNTFQRRLLLGLRYASNKTNTPFPRAPTREEAPAGEKPLSPDHYANETLDRPPQPVGGHKEPKPQQSKEETPEKDDDMVRAMVENGDFIIEPIDRSHEDVATTRARLLYQSRKRGILETDLLLSTFARKHLESMTVAELHEYDKLLDEPDWDIYYWATRSDKRVLPERWAESQILKTLQKHSENEERKILRMPDLPAYMANV